MGRRSIISLSGMCGASRKCASLLRSVRASRLGEMRLGPFLVSFGEVRMALGVEKSGGHSSFLILRKGLKGPFGRKSLS